MILITGATSGLGLEFARYYGDRGYHLHLLGRNNEKLLELKTSKIKYTPINKLPSVVRDIALVCDESTLASEIEKIIRSVSKDMIQSVTIFDVYQGDKVEKGKKSIALKVVYQALDHTLSEDEITSLYQKTIEACKKGLNADLRIA